MSGAIPHGVTRLGSLQRLILHSNALSGPIPEMPASLQRLVLFGNNLSGPLPENLGACTELVSLAVQRNQIRGGIPDSLGQCTKLEVLGLYENRLQGAVPCAELARLTSLRKLGLHCNDRLSISPDGKQQMEAALSAQCMVWWPHWVEDVPEDGVGELRKSAGHRTWRGSRMSGFRQSTPRPGGASLPNAMGQLSARIGNFLGSLVTPRGPAGPELASRIV